MSTAVEVEVMSDDVDLLQSVGLVSRRIVGVHPAGLNRRIGKCSGGYCTHYRDREKANIGKCVSDPVTLVLYPTVSGTCEENHDESF